MPDETDSALVPADAVSPRFRPMIEISEDKLEALAEVAERCDDETEDDQ